MAGYFLYLLLQIGNRKQPSEEFDIDMLVSVGVFSYSFSVDNTKLKSERGARCVEGNSATRGLLLTGIVQFW